MVQSKIQVYASFPLVVPNGSDINLAADNWHWVHCLTLPLETLNTPQFSLKPYKWIRSASRLVLHSGLQMQMRGPLPFSLTPSTPLKDEVSANWMDTFYPEEIMNREQVDYKDITNAQITAKEKTEKQAQERQQRYAPCTAPDTLDILLHLPYMLVLPEKHRAMLREAEGKEHAAERRSLEEKVESWNKKIIK